MLIERVLASIEGSSVVEYEVELGYDDLPLDQVNIYIHVCVRGWNGCGMDRNPFTSNPDALFNKQPPKHKRIRSSAGCCPRARRRPRRSRRWGTSHTSTCEKRWVRLEKTWLCRTTGIGWLTD